MTLNQKNITRMRLSKAICEERESGGRRARERESGRAEEGERESGRAGERESGRCNHGIQENAFTDQPKKFSICHLRFVI
jgi:hypothetical protein